jgi:aspartyl-tRNA(Asn)/glutamyl-tRNA(Gln) amidotransferase subunit A
MAAGMAFGAVGTDTGGSIRHPSSVCGVVGMKPTFGLVSQRGVVPVSLSLDHVGPMTLTVRDNALMLQAMAGHDGADPNSLAADVNPDFTDRIGQPLKGLRAGVPMNLIDPGGLDQRVVQAFERALEVLRALGLDVEIFDMDGVDAVHADSSLILEYEAYREHEVRLKQHGPSYGAGLRRRLMNGAQRHESDHARARLKAAALQQSVDRLLTERLSVLLMPGREAPALTLDQLYAETPAARGRMTRLGNFTGVPALVLPMGFSERPKLPLALQVVAARFHEPVIYQVAAAYEAAQPWASQHPDWLG